MTLSNLVIVFVALALSQAASAPDTRADKDFKYVNGKTYGFTIKFGCACGAGSNQETDIYVKTAYKEGSNSWKNIGQTSEKGINNSKFNVFKNAFKLEYKKGVKQVIAFDIWDYDKSSGDDKLAHSVEVEPFTKQDHQVSLIGDSDEERCQAEEEGPCNNLDPFYRLATSKVNLYVEKS